MRIIVMITMLSILAGLFANAGRHIYLWLKLIFGGISKPLFGVLFGVAVLAVLAAFVVSRIPGMGNCRRVFRIAHYGLGILCYVVMIANIAGLLLFVGRRARLVPCALLWSAISTLVM